MVNGYVDLGTWYGVTPFVGAGVGVAVQQALRRAPTTARNISNATAPAGLRPPAASSATGSKTDLAWALMAGFDIAVTRNLKLELGYRYLDYGKFKTGSAPVPAPATAASAPSLRLRLRRRLEELYLQRFPHRPALLPRQPLAAARGAAGSQVLSGYAPDRRRLGAPFPKTSVRCRAAIRAGPACASWRAPPPSSRSPRRRERERDDASDRNAAARQRRWRLWDRPLLLMTATSLIWAGHSVVGKLAVGEIGPMTLTFLRWTLAHRPDPVRRAARPSRADFRVLRQRWLYVASLGALGYTAFNALF